VLTTDRIAPLLARPPGPSRRSSRWSITSTTRHRGCSSRPSRSRPRCRVQSARPATGPVRTCLLYSPTVRRAPAPPWRRGLRPPVHIAVHGGAFIVRMPEQEDNVARYLASELGCYVLAAGLSHRADGALSGGRAAVLRRLSLGVIACPRARHWDDRRISVGGPSAGAKLAMSVVQQALDHGFRRAGGPLDRKRHRRSSARPDALRTSPAARPIVTRDLMALVRTTYFAGTNLHRPAAVSPLLRAPGSRIGSRRRSSSPRSSTP
jgi:acetyl esterase/lipase